MVIRCRTVAEYHLLLDLSWKLKGRLHEAGTHSAGVVFGTVERHLSEHIPLEPSGTARISPLSVR